MIAIIEGATVRWHGHTNESEPDTAPPSANEPPDTGQLWGWGTVQNVTVSGGSVGVGVGRGVVVWGW